MSPVVLVAALAVEGVLVVGALVGVLLSGESAISPSEEVAAQATTTAGTRAASAPDMDHDGTPDARDPDDDNDGWRDIDDPKSSGYWTGSTWHPNLDHDAIVNPQQDQDDDNDGVPDTRDRYPLDQNNNGTNDFAEHRTRGERFDGDGDGRGDLAELRRVALAEAEKLGVRISTSVLHLADVPAQVFRSLPDGWNYVCQDRDNDGNPDATDLFDRSPGGSYTAYTHDGRWEDNYGRLAHEAQQYGFVPSGYTPGGEPPRYEVPTTWAGYVPGSTAYTADDPHASFYGSIPTGEHTYYGGTTTGSTGGTTSTTGTTTTGGTTTDTHTYTSGGTESFSPPPPPPAEPPPAPPPPPSYSH